MAQQRSIQPFEFQGKTIYIEVTDMEPVGRELTSGRDTGPGKLALAGEAVRDTIAALAATVQQGMAALAPDEWKLEVTLGFKGKSGIPFIAQGEGSGSVKVSATWKPKQEES